MSRFLWTWQNVELRWFAPQEFDHPELMQPRFLWLIDEWRHRAGVPVIVTDDARTIEEHRYLYRDRIARGEPVPNSSHLRGCALDYKTTGTDARFALLWSLTSMWKEGLWLAPGFEIATSHDHVDEDPVLRAAGRRPALFTGVSK